MIAKVCSFDGCEKKVIGRGWCGGHYRRWQLHGDPSVCTTNQGLSVIDRFWMKVQKGTDCWLWVGAISDNGYGSFRLPSGARGAHRIAYEWSVGPIPEGMDLDHRCSTRSCVNPSHLRPVTRKQNMEHMQGPPITNSTGALGVTRSKRTGRYVATVRHNGRRVQGGSFLTPEEAGQAAKQLRLELFTHNDVDRKTA